MIEARRILIVDDDPTVLHILHAILAHMRNGYQIVAAQDGRAALAMIEDEPFDLVITDIKMPGVDGIELAESIQGMNATTAVIWITAYGCHRLQAECERLGIYRCLDKPLRISEIRQVALEALRSILVETPDRSGGNNRGIDE